jgi:hypothetical protein
MIKADLHNHLGSNGKNPGFDETIDLVHNKLGPNSAFGIADSDDYRYEQFVEQEKGRYHREYITNGRAVYVPEKEVLVVKCQEMFTKEGHILAIAMPYGKIVKTKKAKDAIKEAKDLGAILSAVHPFYRDGIGKFLEENPELLQSFSNWEVYNGSAEFSFPKILPKGSNDESMNFYLDNLLNNHSLNIGVSSFTDGHDARVIGTCYTNLQLKDKFMISMKGDVVESLDNALREVKCTKHLCMEPNEKDAAIHAVKMALVKLKLRSD